MPTNFTGSQIKDTYDQILHVDGGPEATEKTIYSAVVADTSATIPTVTQARLGSDGTNYLNGHLASISYYDSFSEQIYTRRKNKAVFNLM